MPDMINNQEKKKKSLWGWGIIFFYSIFVLAFIGLLIYTKTINVDLVDENYYEKDVAYQGTIDRMNNAKSLDSDITVKQVDTDISITFPEVAESKDISGAIRVLRPSEKDFDINIPINLTHGYQVNVPKTNLPKGKWVVQVEWEANDIPYYFEKSIMVY